ncbi:cysteine and histidine-rich protein 1 homolog [Drosophila persimilis]|uniref:cysteine and histidine-rich protein 1 homolog n=1 Tax=Drosophila persimilis TaxID=7234 RepID=UPI000F096BE4|nr:cysteine and histidine-rich protein 1 homolog [Drosophila persimilis]
MDSSEGEVGGSSGGGVSDLRERLHNILVCVVCREVPQPHDFYQCSHGHIMCEDCKTAVLAVAIFNKTRACCPSCRSLIRNYDQEQNLVVRQTLWELPISCPSCNDQFSDRKDLCRHLEFVCEGRVVCWKYHCVGCSWKGSYKDSVSHDSDCGFPQKQGKEILDILLHVEDRELEAQKPVLQLHRVLSASRTIRAFEEDWVLRLRLKRAGEKITVSGQLLLSTTPRVSLMVDHLIQMPQSVCSAKQLHDIRPRIYRHIFDSTGKCAKRQELPLAGPQALYRLFAMTRIQLRLWMFLHY